MHPCLQSVLAEKPPSLSDTVFQVSPSTSRTSSVRVMSCRYVHLPTTRPVHLRRAMSPNHLRSSRNASIYAAFRSSGRPHGLVGAEPAAGGAMFRRPYLRQLAWMQILRAQLHAEEPTVRIRAALPTGSSLTVSTRVDPVCVAFYIRRQPSYSTATRVQAVLHGSADSLTQTTTASCCSISVIVGAARARQARPTRTSPATHRRSDRGH